MKRIIIRSVTVFMTFFLTMCITFSQLDVVGKFVAGGLSDAEFMLTEYIRPMANIIGSNLNGGWYNTAKPHNLGGFDITFTTSIAFAPVDHRTYDLSPLLIDRSVDNLRLEEYEAKTAAGSKGAGPAIRYVMDVPAIGEQDIASYDHPGGTGLSWLPSPMINACVGLIKGTEIMGRYMPTIKYGANKANTINLWGIGIKYDLKQWIPFVKRVPVLHMAVMYGYTNVKFHGNLTPIEPSDLGPVIDRTTTADWNTQNMDLQFKGHTANLLISANLPVVCFYGGAGVSITNANLNLNGDFPVPSYDLSDGPVVTDDDVETDPVAIKIKNQDGGTTKPRLNAGIRFKFAVITLHFDYTLANYSVATVGLGVSFR